MTSTTKPERMEVLKLLKACRTLHEAEDALKSMEGYSQPYCWGIWDGWQNRPYSLAGLELKGEKLLPLELKQEYEEGRDLGYYLTKWSKNKEE